MSKSIDLTRQDFGYWHVLERGDFYKTQNKLFLPDS